MTENTRVRLNERPCTCSGDCKVLRIEASYGTAKINYSWCVGTYLEVSDFFAEATEGMLSEIDETEEYVFGEECQCHNTPREPTEQGRVYGFPIEELRWTRDASLDTDNCENFNWSDHGYDFLDFFNNSDNAYLGPDIHGVGITHEGVGLVTGRRYAIFQQGEGLI